jgi:hypothetical protein
MLIVTFLENRGKTSRYPDTEFERERRSSTSAISESDQYSDIDRYSELVLTSNLSISQQLPCSDYLSYPKLSPIPTLNLTFSENSPEIDNSDNSPTLPPVIAPFLLKNIPERTVSLSDLHNYSAIAPPSNFIIRPILKKFNTHSNLTCTGCYE